MTNPETMIKSVLGIVGNSSSQFRIERLYRFVKQIFGDRSTIHELDEFALGENNY